MGINSGSSESRSELALLNPRKTLAAGEQSASPPSGDDDGWDVRDWDQILVLVNGDASGSVDLFAWKLFRVPQATSGKLEETWHYAGKLQNIPTATLQAVSDQPAILVVDVRGSDRFNLTLSSVTGSSSVYVNVLGLTKTGEGQFLTRSTIGDDAASATKNVNVEQVGGTDTASSGEAGVLSVAGDSADDAADSDAYPVKIGAVADQVPSSVSDGDRVHLITDLERFVRTSDKTYDSLLDKLKAAVNTTADDRDPEYQTIADESDVDADTYNYPSDSGIEIGNRNFLAMIYSIQDVTSVEVQVSNDATSWADASESVVANELGVSGNAATHWTSAAGVTSVFGADWEKCGHRYIRWQVVVPNATNGISITLVQRAS